MPATNQTSALCTECGCDVPVDGLAASGTAPPCECAPAAAAG